jgi:hypothetical protein
VPRCSYINTDFFGDDIGDGKGLTASSALVLDPVEAMEI